MDVNYNNLIKQFKKIANNGWIQGVNNSTNSIGLIFEKQLEKDFDSLFLPDFEGIEIKCKSRFSNYPITLFTQAFDGPNLYETNEILEKFGRKDYQFNHRKTLITNLETNKIILFNNKYYFKLKVDRIKEKIFLQVFDKDKKLIEEKSYVQFDYVKPQFTGHVL